MLVSVRRTQPKQQSHKTVERCLACEAVVSNENELVTSSRPSALYGVSAVLSPPKSQPVNGFSFIIGSAHHGLATCRAIGLAKAEESYSCCDGEAVLSAVFPAETGNAGIIGHQRTGQLHCRGDE